MNKLNKIENEIFFRERESFVFVFVFVLVLVNLWKNVNVKLNELNDTLLVF